MSEAEELHRIISASVRDMLDAYRIQAAAGPVTLCGRVDPDLLFQVGFCSCRIAGGLPSC